MTAFRVEAPAKVNPWLAVLGKRVDGFHNVDLGLLALELADCVTARATDTGGVELELAGPALTEDVPADDRNLAWRAATAVLALAPDPGQRGIALQLDKHVPTRAGLGGGSSDAAAACLATALALGLELGPLRPHLFRILAELGSDCPFFLAAETGFARCTGRGEEVEVMPAVPADWHLALVAPDLEVPTGVVYAHVTQPERVSHASVRFDGSEEELRASLYNDLEAPALLAVPELAGWRELLDATSSGFRMSGSGSSFFACFRDPERAADCLAEVETLAAARGLSLRGAWLTRPAGHAVRLLD